MYLIPGGRYLVTENTELKVVSLWDLGLPGSKETQTMLVAHVVVESSPHSLSVSFVGSLVTVGIIGARRSEYVPFIHPGRRVKLDAHYLDLLLSSGLWYTKSTSQERHSQSLSMSEP